MDIPLEGKPRAELQDLGQSGIVTFYPSDFRGIKARLKVKEGDTVKRGEPLFFNKRNDAFKLRAPAGGTVKSIVIGQRRAIEKITIEIADREEVDRCKQYDTDQLLEVPREELLAHLQDTGCLSFLQQRPFSRMVDPQAKPKSIFVNGMSTAPFQPDPNVEVTGSESELQGGLNALTRLTEGKVHLCLDADAENPSPALTGAKNVEIHYFRGPHPSGNTSTHIHYIDPIKPHDIVWAVRAGDLAGIGRLLLTGEQPTHRIITLGGPGVKEAARMHYKVRMGETLDYILNGRIEDGEQRIVRGDLLSGVTTSMDECHHCHDPAINVIPEDRERHLMGWITPGLLQYSVSRSFLSRWLLPKKKWALGTNAHGSKRAMILTGLYDKYVPLHLMTDFLLRAILARDSDEAILLGILETDPEDFALPAFVCPSKTDVMGIIRQGLAQIEEEGI